MSRNIEQKRAGTTEEKMDNQKIAFISCVSDEVMYRECLLYIGRLEVPDGYQVECVAIRNAVSVTEGYNTAMHTTDAKYKVYLHQDVYILNRRFLHDILNIFQADETIGLMGMIGAQQLLPDAIWWGHGNMVGAVYNKSQTMQLLDGGEIVGTATDAQAVDGLLLATQQDIPFREDLFDGEYYYDVSQCVEFQKRGLRVIVPQQSTPWCLHTCGQSWDKQSYDRYRRIFLCEYSAFLFPLVSILIPTYNRPEYFRLALESALNQTYLHTEILIGDDSTNEETEKLVREQYLGNHPNIRYYHNEKNLGQFDNDLKLLSMAQGNYVNFLMDDDLFHLQKIEKMASYFITDKSQEISLVTSHRMQINAEGKELGIFGQTDRIIQKDTVLDGIGLGNYLLCNNFNMIGEPTTVLFDKRKLHAPFGTFGGRRYYCNVDQAAWLELLTQGKAIFINQALSSFRIYFTSHVGKNSEALEISADLTYTVWQSRRYGYLHTSNSYLEAVQKVMFMAEQDMRLQDVDHLRVSDKRIYLEILLNLQKLFDWKHGLKCMEKDKPPYILAFGDLSMHHLDYSILIRFVAEGIANLLEQKLLQEQIDVCLTM
ncbi:MAG: glycosyltransferase [Ethanoligenens sp.]